MLPIRSTARWLRPILALLTLAGFALLGGCGGGSGAPNNPFAPPPTTPGPVTILPATSVAYSNTPTSLAVSGGSPPYTILSSNSAILPVAQSNTTGTIVLIAANVLADTVVVITAQDSTGATGTAQVTVKAAPIFNNLTVKPASAACGTNSICSGQTGTASVTVTGPTGAGIPNRQVRFDVVSGAFGIKTSDPANPLAQTLTVVSDQFGVAQAILQAVAGVPTQPAQLRATEITSGNQQTAQFTIVQTINGSAVLSVIPTDITFNGADNTGCSNNFRGDYYIFGGTPPYQVFATPPQGVFLQNVPVTAAGGFFSVISKSDQCVNPETLLIVDAAGLTTTATFHNLVGTGAPPPAPTPSPLVVTPASQSGGNCDGATQYAFAVTGGTANYNAAASLGSAVVQPNAHGFFFVTPPNAPGAVISVVVVDSGSPQLSASATITCN
jgi:hypothetical protein